MGREGKEERKGLYMPRPCDIKVLQLLSELPKTLQRGPTGYCGWVWGDSMARTLASSTQFTSKPVFHLFFLSSICKHNKGAWASNFPKFLKTKRQNHLLSLDCSLLPCKVLTDFSGSRAERTLDITWSSPLPPRGHTETEFNQPPPTEHSQRAGQLLVSTPGLW